MSDNTLTPDKYAEQLINLTDEYVKKVPWDNDERMKQGIDFENENKRLWSEIQRAGIDHEVDTIVQRHYEKQMQLVSNHAELSRGIADMAWH